MEYLASQTHFDYLFNQFTIWILWCKLAYFISVHAMTYSWNIFKYLIPSIPKQFRLGFHKITCQRKDIHKKYFARHIQEQKIVDIKRDWNTNCNKAKSFLFTIYRYFKINYDIFMARKDFILLPTNDFINYVLCN